MNSKKRMSLLLLVCFGARAISFDFIKKLPTSFSKKLDLETEQKEYPIKQFATITVKNDIGDIYIRTEPNRSNACLQVIKRASKGTDVSHLRVQVNASDHTLVACTINNNTGVDSALDYMITVPEQVSVNATTATGNIIVEKVLGKVTATTNYGNIDLYQIGNNIVAHALDQGNITIEQPTSKVQAKTKKGNIKINDVCQTVHAQTRYGLIDVKSEQLRPNCSMKLANHHGQINLALPKSGINAEITACTKRGKITSEKEITLNPQTVRLDAGSWKDMQMNIQGTIGNAEAHIKLATWKGNIKITEIKS